MYLCVCVRIYVCMNVRVRGRNCVSVERMQTERDDNWCQHPPILYSNMIILWNAFQVDQPMVESTGLDVCFFFPKHMFFSVHLQHNTRCVCRIQRTVCAFNRGRYVTVASSSSSLSSWLLCGSGCCECGGLRNCSFLVSVWVFVCHSDYQRNLARTPCIQVYKRDEFAYIYICIHGQFVSVDRTANAFCV